MIFFSPSWLCLCHWCFCAATAVLVISSGGRQRCSSLLIFILGLADEMSRKMMGGRKPPLLIGIVYRELLFYIERKYLAELENCLSCRLSLPVRAVALCASMTAAWGAGIWRVTLAWWVASVCQMSFCNLVAREKQSHAVRLRRDFVETVAVSRAPVCV